MIAHNLNALDLLTQPVWIVSPCTEELVFANRIAREVMQGYTFSQLRKGGIPPMRRIRCRTILPIFAASGILSRF